MNKKKLFISSVTGLGLLFATMTPALAASFTNGSFETSSVTPGAFTTLTAVDSATLSPWTVTSGNIDLIGSYWNASNGTQSLDMNGTTNGSISQQFDTTPGYTYVVKFDLSGNPDGGPTVKTMDVTAGGTTSSYSYDTVANGTTRQNMNWKPQTFTFKASSNATALTFTSTTGISSSFGPALDNVTVGTNPASFVDCNSYQNFVNANGKAFTNKGLCIAFIVQNLHRTEGGIGYTANSLVRHGQWGIVNDGTSALGAVGAFGYTDANHDWYIVDAKDLNVSGNTAWFAGKVTNASQPTWVGQWLFAKVVDNSPDMIWGSFTDQATAQSGVASMTNPADGPFNVTSGNLKVH